MTLANVLRTFVRLEKNGNGVVPGVKGMRLYETGRRGDFGFPAPERGQGNMRVVLE